MSDKKFFWLSTSLIILFISLPFLLAGFIQLITGYYYTGVNFSAGGDKTVYLSYMEQARQGQWLFKNLFTSEAQQALLFSPLWLVLGKLSWLFNLSNILIFHLSRVALAFLFLSLIYRFLKNYFFDVIRQRLVFVFTMLASGLGVWSFLSIILKGTIETNINNETIGTDMWISEANTFTTLIHSPLFILSQILILIIFIVFLKNLNQYSVKKVLTLFFLTLILGILHPYDLVIIFGVLTGFTGVYSIRQRKICWSSLFNLFIMASAAFINFVYFYFIFNQQFALKGWLGQNVIHSPAFYYYLLGYGLIFLFFLLGLPQVLKKSKNYYFLFLFCWAFIQLSLLYFPLQFQTKMSNGLHLPLTIIAGLGFFWLWQKAREYFTSKRFKNILFKNLILQIFIILLISSNIFIVFFEFSNVFSLSRPFFLNDKEMTAINWLKDNTADEAVVLFSSKEMGNLLPSIITRQVYLGHGHQTVNWFIKLEYIKWFYDNNLDDQEKIQWLKDSRITHVFFYKNEINRLDLRPAEKKYLEKVYENLEVSIYLVKS